MKYGKTEENLIFLDPPRIPRELFEERLKNNELLKASYVFSRAENSKSREVFLYFLFRLKLLDKSEFTDLLFSVYAMPDTNTSFFQFFSYETIISMLEHAELPYLSKDPYNDYVNLPDEVTIYRGLRSKPTSIENCGFSWTLKEKLAKNFAFQGNAKTTGFMVSGQVSKPEIFAYLTNRGEYEVVVSANSVRNKTIKEITKSDG